MPNLNVTYQDMRDAASKLTAGEDEIDSKLRELKNQIDSLISGGYVTDKSSVAFGSSYEEFNSGITQTVQGLDGMAQYLTGAADALEETDAQLASNAGK